MTSEGDTHAELCNKEALTIVAFYVRIIRGSRRAYFLWLHCLCCCSFCGDKTKIYKKQCSACA